MRATTNILALLIVLGAAFSISAEAVGVERFSFARPPAPDSTVDPTGRLSVDLDRWSTNAERDQLVKAIAENGPEKLLDAFREVGRIGTVSWPGGLDTPCATPGAASALTAATSCSSSIVRCGYGGTSRCRRHPMSSP